MVGKEDSRAMYGFPLRSVTNLSSHMVVMGPEMILFPPSVGQAYHEKAPSKEVVRVVASAGSCKLGMAKI